MAFNLRGISSTLAACLAASGAVDAQVAAPVDAPAATAVRVAEPATGDAAANPSWQGAWGPYAQLAGTSTSLSAGGTALHWQWQVPGQVLAQEYRKADGSVVRRDLIRPGSEAGTLVLESQGGLIRKEQLVGTLQPDGHVLFRSALGGKQYVAALANGAWELRPVRFDDGRMVALEGASRFPLAVVSASPGAPVGDTGPSRVASEAAGLLATTGLEDTRAASAGDGTADGPTSGPVAASTPAPEAEPAGGNAAPVAIATSQALSEDAGKAAAMLERLFTAWLAGRQPAEDMVERLAQLPVTRDMAALGPAREIRFTGTNETDNGYVFDVAHANARAHWTLFLDRDGGLIRNVKWKPLPPFAGERPLAIPTVWGRVAVMAIASVMQGANTRYYRVSPDGHAIYVLNVHESGHVVPEEILRPVGDGTFVRRRYLHPGMRRETFYRGQAMDGQTVRWGMVGMSEDYAYHDWTIPANDASGFIFTVYQFDEVRSSREYRMGLKLHPAESLAEAIAQAQAQDVGIVARYSQRRAEFLANNSGHSSNPWARALYDGLNVATLAARESEARSRAHLEATVAGMQAEAALEARAPQGSAAPAQAAVASAGQSRAQAGGAQTAGSTAAGATTSSPGKADAAQAQAPSAPAAAKPLRFVLTIGMRNLPGDAHNSMCYSNVITRPGPPGWGAPGFLPSGSSEQAHAEVDRLKSQFIELCRGSGREITSEGNFAAVMNRGADDDARVDATRPRHAEDVAVTLR